LINENNKDYLVAFSSFSAPNRNKILVVDIKSKGRKKKFMLSAPIKNKAIKELNIEGSTLINGKLILSNRANNTTKINHLIITRFDLDKGIEHKNIHTIRLRLPQNKMIIGISSITYLQSNDMLIFAATTENTADARSDGEIGNSYIGYIKNISAKLNLSVITIDAFISISKFLKKDSPQKIESVVVEEQINDELIIDLAADNDNGESTLFKLRWKL
jgi:hypothetical protein